MKPILIYKESPVCYNVLNHFADQLGNAFIQLGETVEYYNAMEQKEAGLAAYAGREYKAVIGFQSYLFDIYLPKAGVYLHDLIKGPKINFQFDHPIWMKQHYVRMPQNCYIATHDRNYAAFIEKYYPRINGTIIATPGGCKRKLSGEAAALEEKVVEIDRIWEQKKYGITFVGTYANYRNYLPIIRGSEKMVKQIAAHFLFYMKLHPDITAESALEASLMADGIRLSQEDFLEVLDGVKPMIYCVMSYYREKVVEAILAEGIELEVYGDSWRHSPFSNHPGLHIHPEVTVEESLMVMEESRISLNVMAWHKDGFTERIANSMLNNSVVLTDKSTFLQENFTDGEDILLYDLLHLDRMTKTIKRYLDEPGNALKEIAAKAYDKAEEKYTWKQTAEELLRKLPD